jgi:hypothetical protein
MYVSKDSMWWEILKNFAKFSGTKLKLGLVTVAAAAVSSLLLLFISAGRSSLWLKQKHGLSRKRWSIIYIRLIITCVGSFFFRFRPPLLSLSIRKRAMFSGCHRSTGVSYLRGGATWQCDHWYGDTDRSPRASKLAIRPPPPFPTQETDDPIDPSHAYR